MPSPLTRYAPLLALAALAAAPATMPTSGPASRPTLTPAAEALLSSVEQAYRAATSLTVEGKIRGEFDIAGRQQTFAHAFRGVGDGGGRFFGEVLGEKGQPVQAFAADGQNLTLYNAVTNTYATVPAAAKRVPAGDLVEPFVLLMLDGDASSLLLLCDDPAAMLRKGATKLDADGDTLLWESGDEKRRFTFDPQTRLLKRLEIDYAPLFAARETSGAKRAIVVIDYTTSDTAATVDPARFAFKPPASASEFVLPVDLMRGAATSQPSR